jgi:rhodanese-related sulfurtransferase
MKGFFVMLMAALGLASCTGETPFRSVDVAEFKKIIARPGTQLVDVRTPGEHAQGHIDGSINIDVKSSSFEADAGRLLDKERAVAIYCRSGRRSKQAGEILHGMGFKVIELDSGYMGWAAAE